MRMGHYMTKEGVPIICKNCLYWSISKYSTCGHANQKLGRVTGPANTCGDFWPKHQHRL